jgi:hypothetical protein
VRLGSILRRKLAEVIMSEADSGGSGAEEEQNLQDPNLLQDEEGDSEEDANGEVELVDEDSEEDESDDPQKPTLKNLYAGNFVSGSIPPLHWMWLSSVGLRRR